MFLSKGIKSVTMDEIAKSAGVSKKTLYEIFENKSRLVEESVILHLSELRAVMAHLQQEAENAISEVLLIENHFTTNKRNFEHNSIKELSKYYPEAYEHFILFKNDFLKKNIEKIILRGQEEGFFRNDINPSLLSEYRVFSLFHILEMLKVELDLEAFLNMNQEITKNFLLGLMSPQGHDYYDNMQIR